LEKACIMWDRASRVAERYINSAKSEKFNKFDQFHTRIRNKMIINYEKYDEYKHYYFEEPYERERSVNTIIIV
jgi:hypothetical protein